MHRDRSVTFRLPEPLLTGMLRAARASEMTAGDFLRSALSRRVAEVEGGDDLDAILTIRRALSKDFAEATGWTDLQRRLRAHGFVLRRLDGLLYLFTWPVERRLLPLTRFGFGEEDLTLAFRAPFPAHGAGPARALARRRVA